MRVVVIGGTGHIGTFLVPRLVSAGHEVIVVSRGLRTSYQPHDAWTAVHQVVMDRAALEADGRFGAAIMGLAPDAVIDLICFTPESATHLVESVGTDAWLLHCGTIWVHGHSTVVPTTEEQPRRPFGDYGIRKASIEALLLEASHAGRARATVLHPGHIVGPGWPPLNPAGHFDPSVFTRLATGQRVTLPNLGMETVHHVHADDVAQAFERALAEEARAIGESFHVVSPAAMTLRGYAEGFAASCGRTAELEFLPWSEWSATVGVAESRATWDHITHSPNCSIAKARERLGYAPRYSSLGAVLEAVRWLVAAGRVEVPDPRPIAG